MKFRLFIPALILVLYTLSSNLKAQELMKYGGDMTDLPRWAVEMYKENADPGLVIQLYESYYQSHPFVKNFHTQYYKRWLRNIGREQKRTPSEDRDYLNLVNRQSSNRNNASWECIGPYDWDHHAAGRSYAPGSAHVYTVEQSVSNPDVLYAGTATTGLWKSTNRGMSWFPLTNGLLRNEVYAIEIDYTNPDIIYASLFNSIYKSINGGVNFQPTGNAAFQALNLNIRDIRMSPVNNQVVFACTNNGLYRTTDAGNSWTQIVSGDFQEVEIHPSNANVIYAVRVSGNLTQFYKSENGGASFTQTGTGWPVPPADGEQKRTELAVSPASPNHVYALCTGKANGGEGLYGVYVSTNQGASWTFRCCGPQPAGPPSLSNPNLMGWNDDGTDNGGQYYYDLAFAVSPVTADSIFVGGVNMWVSGNGGSSFVCPAKWSHPHKANYVHADIHDIHYYAHTNEIWVACDGGIFYSNNNGASFERRTVGIQGTDFWGFGQGWWYGDVMLGGAYHNGTMLKEDNVYINDWLCTDGGDGTLGFVNPGIDRQVYSWFDIKTLKSNRNITPETRDFYYKPNNTYITGRSNDLLFDPRYYTHWLTGSGTRLFKTRDNGYTFELIYDFGEDIAAMDQCWTHPDVLYVCTFPDWWGVKKIFRSTNGGKTWTNITPSSAQLNGNTWIPYDIAVDHQDPMKVWIVRTSMYDSNINGYSVYYSANGGNTWQNISGTGLNGHSPTGMFLQKGSNGGVYVGTRRAVFYRDNALNDWVLYNQGQPVSTHSTRLEGYYRKNKIRNASNRSVWESPFYQPSTPIAQASAQTDVISCVKDTAYFVDHSIVSDQNVSWSWSFPGGTPSSSSERTQKVVYNQPGVYDVTLTVSDANGSDTRVFAGFIKVLDECKADTIPGLAVKCNGSPDYVRLPSLGVTTNNFTITAWIKPDTIQPGYASVYMNDGTAGGLNFRPGNNMLGYHWPGGQWWWDSGLTVPVGVWSYVAMVVTPTSVRLYLNGVGSTHTVNVSPLALGPGRIGSYQGWSDRNFRGEIDEVCIWNRSLTEAEIRASRHLTKKPELENQMLAYYQFNGNISYAYDAKGGKHGIYNGNIKRVRSRVPVGKGSSHTLTVNSAGLYNFQNADMEIQFSNPHPNGQVVVSRLNVKPDTLVNNLTPMDDGYWIINNYGSNASFANPLNVTFKNTGTISQNMQSSYEFFSFSRGVNAHAVPWEEMRQQSLTVTSGMRGNLNFELMEPLNQQRQLFIARSNAPSGTPEILLSAKSIPSSTVSGGQSMALYLEGTHKGIGLPNAEDNYISLLNTPTEGLLSYNADCKCLVFYNGTSWRKVIHTFRDVDAEVSSTESSNLTLGGQTHQRAIIDLSGNQGFIKWPAMHTSQIIQIEHPVPGMMVYNTELHNFMVFNGSRWAGLVHVPLSISSAGSVENVAQGILAGGGTKDALALMQVNASHKTVAMESAQPELIKDAFEGLMIYDKTTGSFMIRTAYGWNTLTTD
jgi:PKD repeat protein